MASAEPFYLFSRGEGNGHKKRELNTEQRTFYKAMMDSIDSMRDHAFAYAKRNCKTCSGKGHFTRDHIYPVSERLVINQKKEIRSFNKMIPVQKDEHVVKVTQGESYICHCVENNVKQEIINGKPRKEYR